jgi:hypothetical protein
VLVKVRNNRPELSQALIEARSSRQGPRRSGRTDPSLPRRSTRSGNGSLLSRIRIRTRTESSAGSNPGRARRIRIGARQSPNQIRIGAGVREPEAVEEAMTATATTIQAIGRPSHPTGADPVADLAAGGDKTRHPGKTQAGLEPEEHHNPHHPQAEEEAAPEPEDHP